MQPVHLNLLSKLQLRTAHVILAREYLVAVVSKKQLIWSELTAGGYQSIAADEDGIIRSRRFPGLWLDADALWKRDLKRLFAVVEQGLATPEHETFVAGFGTGGAGRTG